MHEMDRLLQNVKTAAISGHVNPDGDCVGSCLAAKAYLEANYPDITADVYLQQPSAVFSYLKGYDRILNYVDRNKKYDLLVLLDISSIDRVMEGTTLMQNSAVTVCIDHHKTNEGGFDHFHNEPAASSACEVLYRTLDPAKITYECAEALYTGIVHDTGVFRFSNTSPETMRIAAELMAFDLPFTAIIEDSFFKKSFSQNVMLGRVLSAAESLFDGNVVVGTVSRAQRDDLGLAAKELDGIVNQLANTRNAEIAVFLHELDNHAGCKASLRSWKRIDVSEICKRFGGGGHARAAGCTIKEDLSEAKRLLLEEIGKELKAEHLI